MQRPPYYLDARAGPKTFKPRHRSRVRRDLAAVHNLSYRLSAWARRRRADVRPTGGVS